MTDLAILKKIAFNMSDIPRYDMTKAEKHTCSMLRDRGLLFYNELKDDYQVVPVVEATPENKS